MGRVVHVICGGVRVDWACVERAAQAILGNRLIEVRIRDLRTLVDAPRGVEKTCSLLLTRKAVLQQRTLSHNLPPLAVQLALSMGFKATDPRDKIFAILGISSTCPQAGRFEANYSMGFEETLLYTARYLMLTPERHILLYLSGRGYNRYSENINATTLPSWIPDWIPSNILGCRIKPDVFRRTSSIKQTIALTDDAQRIRIRARRFDVIEKAAPGTGRPAQIGTISDIPQLDFAENMERMYRPIRDWYLQSRQMARDFSVAGRRGTQFADEDFWHVCMSESKDKRPEYLAEARKAFEEFFLVETVGLADKIMNGAAPKSMTSGSLSQLMDGNFATTVTGKAFATTRAGAMVLVPPLSKCGDLLCHIEGTLVPFVLRETGRGSYELVGTCYVHGVPDERTALDWDEFIVE